MKKIFILYVLLVTTLFCNAGQWTNYPVATTLTGTETFLFGTTTNNQLITTSNFFGSAVNLPASAINGAVSNAYKLVAPNYSIFNNYSGGNFLLVKTNGNDTTGARGNSSLPCATLTNAISKAYSNDVIYVYPGTYYLTNNSGVVLTNGLSIIGSDKNLVNIVFPTPPTYACVGMILTNGNITLANFTLSCSNTPAGYDTYPLYIGNTIGQYGAPGTFTTANATNILLYNLNINAYSDCLFVKAHNNVSIKIINCNFSSYYDCINFMSSGTSDTLEVLNSTFTINPVAPYLGYVPTRGIAADGGTITANSCVFNINNGYRISSLYSSANSAFGVGLSGENTATTFNSINNIFNLSSTYALSQIISYLKLSGSGNSAACIFNTDFTCPSSQFIDSALTINWINQTAAFTESVGIQTNSVGPHGYILNFSGGIFTGHTTY